MDFGKLGNLMLSSNEYQNYNVITKNFEKGKYVVRGQYCRLIFNEPLPVYETLGRIKKSLQLDKNDLFIALCKIDCAIGFLLKEFNEKRRDLLNVFVIGNGADNAGVQPNAAAFSNNTHLYLTPAIIAEHNKIGFLTTIVHELGHVFTCPYLLFSQEWGPGIGESFACFFEGYFIPGNTSYYAKIDEFYSSDNHVSLNPYGKSGLVYRDFKKFRGYNASFWIFFVNRFGFEKFVMFIKSGIMKNIMTSKTLWVGVADWLGLSHKVLSQYWLSDLMTAKFYRSDPVTLGFAQRYLGGKKCFDVGLIWKQSQHSALQQIQIEHGKRYQAKMDDKKLEAFGFATFDLFSICYETLQIEKGSRIEIIINGDQVPDQDWIIVVVFGANDIASTIGNKLVIDRLADKRPLMLGIMHTDIDMIESFNDTSKTISGYHMTIQKL